MRLVLLAALATGCAPMIVPWPPPAALTSQMAPLEPAEVEVGVGVSPLLSGGFQGENWLQGTWVGQAGVGLGRDLSLSLTGSRHLLGPTGAATLWWWPVQDERFDAGALLSVGGSWSESTYTFRDDVVDDNGEPVLTEDGDPKTIERTVHYTYASIAPGLGGQVAFKAGRIVSFPVMTRVSYARTFAHTGIVSPRWTTWFELAGGARLQAGRHFAFGAGPQLIWFINESGGNPMPLVNGVVSVEGRFGGAGSER